MDAFLIVPLPVALAHHEKAPVGIAHTQHRAQRLSVALAAFFHAETGQLWECAACQQRAALLHPGHQLFQRSRGKALLFGEDDRLVFTQVDLRKSTGESLVKENVALGEGADPAALLGVGDHVGLPHQQRIGCRGDTVADVFVLGGVAEHLLYPGIGAPVFLVVEPAHHVVVEPAEVRERLPEPQLLEGGVHRHMAVGKAHEIHIGHVRLLPHAADGAGVGRGLILPVGQLAAELAVGFLPHIVHRAIGELGVYLPQKRRNALLLRAGKLLQEAEVDHAGFVGAG